MTWSFRPVTGGRQFSSKRALPLHSKSDLRSSLSACREVPKRTHAPQQTRRYWSATALASPVMLDERRQVPLLSRPTPSKFQQCAEFLSLRNQNQGREPDDRGDEAKPQNGFCFSLTTGRARRALVDPSCFLVAFFGSSATLGFAIGGAGSAVARIGNASDGSGGTHGESA